MKKFVKETSKKLATGALAVLATIGSAGAVDLTEGDMTINGVTEGDIPVYGYQTQKVYTYELNLSWGNMQFIFDRGVYNPNNDSLTKKVTTAPWNYCESAAGLEGVAAESGTVQGVGYWCGFDGTNNRVDIVNLGTGNVGLNVACNEGLSGEQTLSTDDVDMQLAVKSNEMGSSHDGWVFTGDGDLAPNQQTYTDKMQDGTDIDTGYGEGISMMTIAKKGGTVATTTIQHAFPLNSDQLQPGQDRANAVEFYLNITGTPQQSSTSGASNASELDTLSVTTPDVSADYWERLGSIHLTFTPSEDAPRTPSAGV